jgi:hypothetical protein
MSKLEEAARVAAALATALKMFEPIDLFVAMRASFALAMACARKSGGDDMTASACHMLEVADFNEEAAIAAIRKAGAKWRERRSTQRSLTS